MSYLIAGAGDKTHPGFRDTMPPKKPARSSKKPSGGAVSTHTRRVGGAVGTSSSRVGGALASAAMVTMAKNLQVPSSAGNKPRQPNGLPRK